MHPITSNATAHSDGSGRLVADPSNPLVQTSIPPSTGNPGALRVLSVGRRDEDNFMREALSHSTGLCFSHANDYRELWRLSKGNTYNVVVFHNSVCCFELEEAARLVRRLWPSANILLIRSGEITLEDPLYDQRLRPPVDPDTLLSALSAQARPSHGKSGHKWREVLAVGG